MKLLPFLFIFLLLNSVISLPSPPIENVTSHNTALAQSLLNSTENIGNSSTNTPTINDPISFFSTRVFTALPSVDDRISSNHAPLILWGWGEKHEEKIQEEQKTPNCPDAIIIVGSNGAPILENFTALIQLKNDSRVVDLANGTKNLFQIPFSKDELDIQPEKDTETNKSKPIYLNVTISGSLIFPYKKTEHTYTYDCEIVQVNGKPTEVCTCNPITYVSNMTIMKNASSSRSFLLENGNVLFFLLKPVLREQLVDKSEADFAIFSKRLPYKIYLEFDNSTFNAVYINSFSVDEGEFGVQYIQSEEDFHKGVQEGDANITNSANLNSSLSFSSLETYVQPVQLEKENESFSHAYSINASYSNMTGKHELSVLFFDHFNDVYEYDESILTRTMSILSMERGDGGIEITLSDDNGNALANEKVSLLLDGKDDVQMTNENGKIFISGNPFLLCAWFPGDDYYRPSSNYMEAREGSGTIDFSLFGFLVMLLALLAGISFANAKKIFPFSWLQEIWGKAIPKRDKQ